MSTTPTFQSTTTNLYAHHNNPFDAKARKVSAHVETFDQINSMTTIDGTHTYLPESKSFHNVVPRSSHSIYADSEYNHSHILPEESHQFQSPKLSEVPYLNDFAKSAASSSGFNHFLRSDENRNLRLSAPDNSYYYRESASLNFSPVPAKAFSSTLPSHTTSHKTLSSVIGDLVERDREERRLRELKSTEDMVRNNETMTAIIKNEGAWKRGLDEVDSLLKSCKEFSEAATRKRLSSTSFRHSEPVNYQYRPQAIQEKAYRKSENVYVKPDLYKEECEDYLFNYTLRRSRENSAKNLNVPKTLGESIAQEVEEDKELRHRKDMFYMEEMIRNGTTITDMIKNEKTRELELKMSQGNMQYIKDCASKLLL